jgi:hypothetical protein
MAPALRPPTVTGAGPLSPIRFTVEPSKDDDLFTLKRDVPAPETTGRITGRRWSVLDGCEAGANLTRSRIRARV